MRRVAMFATAGCMVLAVAAAGSAAVICQKRSGVLVARDACKKKEQQVDLSAFGAVGPQGEQGQPGDPGTARAYACSQSYDGATVVFCPNRAGKGVVSVVANTSYTGFTCFVLDSSIDAATAVVIASLNEGAAYGGGKANAIVSAFGSANYLGCPPNSVAVVTARYTNSTTQIGLEEVILGVNVAVM